VDYNGVVLTRRQLLALSAAATGGWWLPGLSRAASGGQRRFLFIFAAGGWDTTYTFTPAFDNSLVDMPDDGSVVAQAGGITFVDSEQRPALRAFLEEWGSQTCVLNGIELHSVAHPACMLHMMTGSLHSQTDDWATMLAGAARGDPLIPLVHLSGPLYVHQQQGVAVRVGEAGQLSGLMSGEALTLSDEPITLPDPSIEALEDAFVSARMAARTVASGRATVIAEQAADAAERRERLEALADELDIASGETLLERAGIISTLFADGLARCGMIQHNGWNDFGWDTHGANELQSDHVEDLFGALSGIMADLSSRPGTAGGTLLDEVTVVVLSEMNRYPRLNARGGKEHWTFTSAMLLGAGVAGGQSIGGYSDYFIGEPISLSTGEITDGGVSIGPEHLGATLCQLGGLDPAEYVPDGAPITAAIAG
jgi:uncharacterized protein (DUF1501 family)